MSQRTLHLVDASVYVFRAYYSVAPEFVDHEEQPVHGPQLVLAGVVSHWLRRESGVLRIELKKVELTNCDAALPSIQLFP